MKGNNSREDKKNKKRFKEKMLERIRNKGRARSQDTMKRGKISFNDSKEEENEIIK